MDEGLMLTYIMMAFGKFLKQEVLQNQWSKKKKRQKQETRINKIGVEEEDFTIKNRSYIVHLNKKKL